MFASCKWWGFFLAEILKIIKGLPQTNFCFCCYRFFVFVWDFIHLFWRAYLLNLLEAINVLGAQSLFITVMN